MGLPTWRHERGGFALLAVLAAAAVLVPLLNLAVPPDSALHVPDYTVTLLGKYLCYALAAVALDLVWGYCGILSLGHGAFFALGGYAMGMYLMRQIGERGVYGNALLPDFMVFLNWQELPWYWHGFNHFPFALLMVVLVPGALAFAFGYLAFRSRVSGVYLSIITQALTFALMLAFFRNDMGFGGNNGLTDFKELLGFDLQAPATRAGLFVISALALAGGYLAGAGRGALARRACADRGARCREPHALPGLPGGALQAGRVRAVGRADRHRRGAVRAAGGHHQSGRIRAAQFHRDGGVGGAWRARHAVRRGAGRRRGQLPEDRADRRAAGGVAVLPGRAVHAGDGGPAAGTGRPARAAPERGMNTHAEAHPSLDHHRGALFVENVSVSFDGFKALNDLTLYMDPGELRCLIGPNGAGKTTLMDVITGKTRPDAGEVFFGDRIDLLRLSEAEIAEVGIGRKFQKPTVFEQLSVHENLALALKQDRRVWATLRAKLTGSERDRMDEAAVLIGLAENRQRLAGTLSHGQKQWLEIGMLLLQEPHLMLIDEPVAGMTRGEIERTARAAAGAGRRALGAGGGARHGVRALHRPARHRAAPGPRAGRGHDGADPVRPARDRGLSR